MIKILKSFKELIFFNASKSVNIFYSSSIWWIKSNFKFYAIKNQNLNSKMINWNIGIPKILFKQRQHLTNMDILCLWVVWLFYRHFPDIWQERHCRDWTTIATFCRFGARNGRRSMSCTMRRCWIKWVLASQLNCAHLKAQIYSVNVCACGIVIHCHLHCALHDPWSILWLVWLICSTLGIVEPRVRHSHIQIYITDANQLWMICSILVYLFIWSLGFVLYKNNQQGAAQLRIASSQPRMQSWIKLTIGNWSTRHNCQRRR